MSKSINIKLPVHHNHKKQKGQHPIKPWEDTKEHHISELEQHSKSRQPKHFPTRRWHIQLEKNKGQKV
jgi:hypothetical protein